MAIEYPITVTGIEWEMEGRPIHAERVFGPGPGSWVAVRVAGEKDTHLGVMLGDYRAPAVRFDKTTGKLTMVESWGNPAMWVPALKRVVMGYESWWGEIKSPDDLRQIGEADIQNVWYVKALKALSEGPDNGEFTAVLKEKVGT